MREKNRLRGWNDSGTVKDNSVRKGGNSKDKSPLYQLLSIFPFDTNNGN